MLQGQTATSSHAVEVRNRDGAGPALVLCEHASAHIPARYHGLGLADQDRDSHAVWDPGARAVACHLADALHSPLVASTVSRLVYDCNRPPDAPDAMPARSERIDVPGNKNLTDAARHERIESIYNHFCTFVSGVITARQTVGDAPALITVHSFTPVYFGQPRSCQIGILHDDDTRLADAMLSSADLLPHRRIERNVPYGPADGVTHSLKLHGIANDLPNVMIEIRNDLIATPEQQYDTAQDLLKLIQPALAALGLPAIGNTDA